jgi:hypothetical protein
MDATFRLKAGEPSGPLFEYLRNLLLHQSVEISVRTLGANGATAVEEEESDTGYPNGAHFADDTEYLNAHPANRRFLEESAAQLARGEVVRFTSEEFDAFVAKKLAE